MNTYTTPDLTQYDLILVNSSGGKDSQTMLDHVVSLVDGLGISRDKVVVAHADLGRVEWAGTRDLAERQAKVYGLRFEAVKRPQGDLLAQIEKRGMFPDSQNRYCTSDHKRDQISKIIVKIHQEVPSFRRRRTHFRVLNCLGLRAQESPARAKKKPLESNNRISTQSRTVTNWHPILDWSEDQVWASIRKSGVEHHPAYDLGMPRLSCIFCIFAPKAALIIAGKHNPELLDEYVKLEAKMGFTFRNGFTIKSVQDSIAEGEEPEATDGNWNM